MISKYFFEYLDKNIKMFDFLNKLKQENEKTELTEQMEHIIKNSVNEIITLDNNTFESGYKKFQIFELLENINNFYFQDNLLISHDSLSINLKDNFVAAGISLGAKTPQDLFNFSYEDISNSIAKQPHANNENSENQLVDFIETLQKSGKQVGILPITSDGLYDATGHWISSVIHINNDNSLDIFYINTASLDSNHNTKLRLSVMKSILQSEKLENYQIKFHDFSVDNRDPENITSQQTTDNPMTSSACGGFLISNSLKFAEAVLKGANPYTQKDEIIKYLYSCANSSSNENFSALRNMELEHMNLLNQCKKEIYELITSNEKLSNIFKTFSSSETFEVFKMFNPEYAATKIALMAQEAEDISDSHISLEDFNNLLTNELSLDPENQFLTEFDALQEDILQVYSFI